LAGISGPQVTLFDKIILKKLMKISLFGQKVNISLWFIGRV